MAAINGTNPRCRLPWNPILRRAKVQNRAEGRKGSPDAIVRGAHPSKTAKGEATESGGGPAPWALSYRRDVGDLPCFCLWAL